MSRDALCWEPRCWEPRWPSTRRVGFGICAGVRGFLGLLGRESGIYGFKAEMYGEARSLEKYRGQVLVVVNVASE